MNQYIQLILSSLLMSSGVVVFAHAVWLFLQQRKTQTTVSAQPQIPAAPPVQPQPVAKIQAPPVQTPQNTPQPQQQAAPEENVQDTDKARFKFKLPSFATAPTKKPRYQQVAASGGYSGTDLEQIFYPKLYLRRSGKGQEFDIPHWGKALARLIYAKLVPGLRGAAGDALDSTMQIGDQLNDIRRFKRFQWTRVYVDQSVLGEIHSYFSYSKDDLAQQLRQHMLKALKPMLEDHVYQAFNEACSVSLFEGDFSGEKAYAVDFLPLLEPGSTPAIAQGYINMEASTGRPAVPMDKGRGQFQFGDSLYNMEHGYYPLVPEFSDIIEIGPRASSHLITDARAMSSTLILGWSQTRDRVGEIGLLTVRDFQSEDGEELILILDDGAEHPVTDEMEPMRITASLSQKETRISILKKIGDEGRSELFSINLETPKYKFTDLPDCANFEKGFQDIDLKSDLPRLIATQIYVAGIEGNNKTLHPYLHRDQGLQYFQDHGMLSDDAGENVRCIVRLCMPSRMLQEIEKLYGNLNAAKTLAEDVRNVMTDDPDYMNAFPKSALEVCKGGGVSPGLTMVLSPSDDLSANALLVRCMPIFTPDRRREVFGRLLFEDWNSARDRSIFSCKPGVTFFTEYPKQQVVLYASCFPIYDVQIPEIKGAIGLEIANAGRPDARLQISNRSPHNLQAEIQGQSKELSHHGVVRQDLPQGERATILLKQGTDQLKIIAYPEPLPVSQESFFVPEPLMVEFFGVPLSRRLEQGNDKLQYANAPFHNQLESIKPQGSQVLSMAQTTENSLAMTLLNGGNVETRVMTTREDSALISHYGSLEKASMTHAPLGQSFTIYDQASPQLDCNFTRIDLNHSGVLNAQLLLEDYWDRYASYITAALGQRVTRVELARVDQSNLHDPDAHLYLVQTRPHPQADFNNWLFSKGGGITGVAELGEEAQLKLNYEAEVVGPIPNATRRLFLVDWRGEKATRVCFDVEDHLKQVRTYLTDGFISIKGGRKFRPGGRFTNDLKTYTPPGSVSVQNRELRFMQDDGTPRAYDPLNFDPREFCVFFDKENFRLNYRGEERAFVVESMLHTKSSPSMKTVYLIIPDSGSAILGSHALPPIPITDVSKLVLPGLVLKLAQGPIYYG